MGDFELFLGSEGETIEGFDPLSLYASRLVVLHRFRVARKIPLSASHCVLRADNPPLQRVQKMRMEGVKPQKDSSIAA